MNKMECGYWGGECDRPQRDVRRRGAGCDCCARRGCGVINEQGQMVDRHEYVNGTCTRCGADAPACAIGRDSVCDMYPTYCATCYSE